MIVIVWRTVVISLRVVPIYPRLVHVGVVVGHR